MSTTTSPVLPEQEIWFDHFDNSDDDESSDELVFDQNLGADSPFQGPPSPALLARRQGVANPNDVPARSRIWRSLSFDRKKHEFSSNLHDQVQRNVKPTHNRDCGICFAVARKPARTSCCHSLYCYEHIADWLQALPRDSGTCPLCSSPCSLEYNVHRIPSSSRQSRIATPAPLSPTFPLRDIHPLLVENGLVANEGSFVHTTDYDYDSGTDEYPDTRSSSGAEAPQGEEVKSQYKSSHFHPSTTTESEIMGKLCTIIGVGMLLYLIFNNDGAALSDKFHMGEIMED